MKYTLALLLFALAATQVKAQDKIYKTDGSVIAAKISQIEPGKIIYTRTDIPAGPVYILKQGEVDSVVYSNGVVDHLQAVIDKKKRLENIPQLNTWTFDLLGFTFLSVSQSYERRTKNGKIGYRVPLYIGFGANTIAGVGAFTRGDGVFYDYGPEGLFTIATGFNPKFYLFKRRKIRAFIGPELNIGFRTHRDYYYVNDYYNYNNGYYVENHDNHKGTLAALGSAGISINPVDKFNITIHGGCGVGGVFSKYASTWHGVWQIGLALGTNF